MRADLHIHSNVSDGSAGIDEIIEMAKRAGVDAVAVTDHDTLAHLPQIPSDRDIAVIGGIEISAMDRRTGQKAHVLGYRIRDVDLVERFARPTLEARHANCLRQIEILRKHGFKIDTQKLNKAGGKYIYRQHIMAYLVSTGQTSDMFGAFYKSVFKNGGICDFDIGYPDVFETVKIVKQAGGKAVLAHPGQQENFALIGELAAIGLDGAECNHPSNGEADRRVIKAYAEKYGLFLTGGSDYHGLYEARSAEIGGFLSEESGALALFYD